MNKKKQKALAEKKILIYFENAQKFSRQQEVAKEYMRKAKRLAMHFNIKLSREMRKKFCKNCCTFFTSKNCTKRIKHGFLVLKCLNCSECNRFKIS